MITTSGLKIIAIIAMIIDHIASYFVAFVNEDTYYIFKSIGRITMPIFVYLLVQGFFYTKNLKKYIFRVFCLATITQGLLLVLGIINTTLFPNYVTRVNEYMGVLYSYVLSLILITMVEHKILLKSLNKFINFLIRIFVIIIIAIIYLNIDIEFDMRVPFMCIEIYVIEKLFRDSDTKKLFLDREFDKKSQKFLLRIIYIALIGASFVSCLDFSKYHPGYKYSLLYSLIPIFMYNGKNGKKNKFIQTMFYMIFPIQHIILYFLAMFITGN